MYLKVYYGEQQEKVGFVGFCRVHAVMSVTIF
jgi:hypothetical protein